MASNLARVTGTVLSVPPAFAGTSAAGKPFRIETVKILVADADVTTVNFNRDETGFIRGLSDVARFEKDDAVDFLVEVSIYRNEPQFQLQSAWKLSPAELAAAESQLLNA